MWLENLTKAWSLLHSRSGRRTRAARGSNCVFAKLDAVCNPASLASASSLWPAPHADDGDRSAPHTCKQAASVLCAGHQDMPTQSSDGADTQADGKDNPPGSHNDDLGLDFTASESQDFGPSTSPLWNHLPHLRVLGRFISALWFCDAVSCRDKVQGTGISGWRKITLRRGVGRHRGDHLQRVRQGWTAGGIITPTARGGRLWEGLDGERGHRSW